MRFALVCFLGLGLLLAGCTKGEGPQSKAVVRAAVEAHLQKRQNVMLANMTLEVRDVKFSGDTAEAQVDFQSKRDPNLRVGVRYKLRRVGEGWQVESSTPMSGMGSTPHGAAGSATPVTPPEAPALQSSH